jgi:hypothetical protein
MDFVSDNIMKLFKSNYDRSLLSNRLPILTDLPPNIYIKIGDITRNAVIAYIEEKESTKSNFIKKYIPKEIFDRIGFKKFISKSGYDKCILPEYIIEKIDSYISFKDWVSILNKKNNSDRQTTYITI